MALFFPSSLFPPLIPLPSPSSLSLIPHPSSLPSSLFPHLIPLPSSS